LLREQCQQLRVGVVDDDLAGLAEHGRSA